MRNAVLTCVAALIVSACARSREPEQNASKQVPIDTTVLVVDRPTVIGFFPLAKDSAEAMGDAYAEGLSHVRFAVEDAKQCLGGDSARAALVVDSIALFRVRGKTDTLRFSRIDSLSWGAYLLSPDAAPRLVTVSSPSALTYAIARAIPDYFHRPHCSKLDRP